MGFERGPQIITQTFEQRVLSGQMSEAAAREEQNRNTFDIVGRGENGEEIIAKSGTNQEVKFPNLGTAIEFMTQSGGLLYSQVNGERKLMSGKTVDEIMAQKK